MEQPKPARPLGRGLEDVSHVFLSPDADARAGDPAGGVRSARPLPRSQSAPEPVLLQRAARITREQVAAAVQEFEGALEEGLRGIDADLPCGACGTIDLLAIDPAGQLAVVDFDTAQDDALLVRGLSHVDWVATNVPNLRRMFRGLAINFSLPPRLFLLAPQFSPTLCCAARQLAHLPIEWIRYHLLDTPGRSGILFERVSAEISTGG